MKHLVLVGFMGAGKTAVGRRAAQLLGLPFVDTDSLIEGRAGQPIRQLFETQGETAFRDLESEVLADVARGEASVISTGGGAILRPRNVAALKQNGVVIYLKVNAETVLKRTGNRAERPLLAGHADPLARIQELMAAREPHYAQADDWIDAGEGSVDDTARTVIEKWRKVEERHSEERRETSEE